jgi:hypothetical protein
MTGITTMSRARANPRSAKFKKPSPAMDEITAKTFLTAKAAKNAKKFRRIFKISLRVIDFSSRPSPLRGKAFFFQETHG